MHKQLKLTKFQDITQVKEKIFTKNRTTITKFEPFEDFELLNRSQTIDSQTEEPCNK